MSLYSKFFAFIYDPFMKNAEKGILGDIRARLLGDLKGVILDVGSGTGTNFKFFNAKETQVIAIEPSLAMMHKAKEKASDNINFIVMGINDPKLENIIEPHSLDAIVSTLVLCTIPNPKLALQNFKKWLKPDGKLIIIEHIKSKNSTHAKFQKFVNPAWKIVGEGCNLTRDTDQLIAKAGFISNGNEGYFVSGITWYYGEFTKVDKNQV